MSKIKSIDIHFENCECFNIPSNCIGFMNVDGFKTRYFMQDYHKGDYFISHRAYYVALRLKDLETIKPDINFGNQFIDRVKKYDDITHITYYFNNGKKFTFAVPWNNDDMQYNSWQKIKLFKDSSIYIEIKKRK